MVLRYVCTNDRITQLLCITMNYLKGLWIITINYYEILWIIINYYEISKIIVNYYEISWITMKYHKILSKLLNITSSNTGTSSCNRAVGSGRGGWSDNSLCHNWGTMWPWRPTEYNKFSYVQLQILLLLSDVFKFDAEYMMNEEKYKQIRDGKLCCFLLFIYRRVTF